MTNVQSKLAAAHGAPLTVDEIEAALRALLKAEAALPVVPPDLSGWAGPAFYDLGKPVPSRWQQAIRQAARDPLGIAARQLIRRLGEQLHEMGRVSLMQEVAERLTPKNNPDDRGGHWPDILNGCWDGVGAEGDLWWNPSTTGQP